MDGKKFVLSQGFINYLVDKYSSVRPVITDPMQPDQRLHHEDTVENGIFSYPKVDPNFVPDVFDYEIRDPLLG